MVRSKYVIPEISRKVYDRNIAKIDFVKTKIDELWQAYMGETSRIFGLCALIIAILISFISFYSLVNDIIRDIYLGVSIPVMITLLCLILVGIVIYNGSKNRKEIDRELRNWYKERDKLWRNMKNEK